MKLCKACGCEKPTTEFHKDKSKNDGLNAYCKACQIARQKEYAARPPRRIDPEGFKTCQTCKQTKTLDEFFNATGTFDKKDKICKPCRSARYDRWRRQNLPKARDAANKWRRNNPRLAKDHKLKSTYGIPLGTYEALFKKQEGKCAICHSPNPGGRGDFHIDHCHDTQVIRGLLCHGCNVGIGYLQHNPKFLRDAASYVEGITQT